MLTRLRVQDAGTGPCSSFSVVTVTCVAHHNYMDKCHVPLLSGLQNREQALANLPDKVKEFCPDLRCIIDGTEIFIEQPKNPEAQQFTFSTYKNHNTLKALIGISGVGVINFVSTLEGGSISDRDLTVKCGLLNKDWSKGDVLMADRGFEI